MEKKKKIRRKKRQEIVQKPETARERAKRRWHRGLISEQLRAKHELMKKQTEELEKQILRNERRAFSS